MPFVQDSDPATAPAPAAAALPTDAVATPSAAAVQTATVAPDAASATAPTVVPATEVVTDAKPAVTADTKAGDSANVKSETKAESQAPRITITKTEAVTTPLAPKAPGDAIWLFTWIPLVIMMGLWLYLRGRNQAADRARADALLATSSKKSKKSSRSQAAEFRADDGSGSITQVAGDRIGRGNSKKNKKDKQQQKKKQAQAGATAAKANSVAESSATASSAAQSAVAKVADQPESVKSKSQSAKNSSTLAATAALATERKTVAPVAQPAKAIFEPLRKITVSARKMNDESELEAEENDEQDFAPTRKRRPSPPPPVITTPAKVSAGRFEKLNLPPANAGLGASSANRWPTEATRPVAAVRVPQPANVPRVHSANAEAAKSDSPAPITARGLGAFVKLAKPNAETESTAVDTDEIQTETSGT